jgi:hypothetical protein
MLIAALADGVTAAAEVIRGLSDDEIGQIERDQAAPLPATYRRFLELAGGGAGRFLRGTVVFHPDVIGLGRAARELLADNGVPPTLGDADRVILMHQGYRFDVLRGTADDPEVWSYCDGSDGEDGRPLGVVPTYPSFTDWLEARVTEQTAAWSRLVPWYEAQRTKGHPRVALYREHPDGRLTEEF